jgi:hypothetical protein
VLDERSGIESGRTHHVRIEGAAEETALIPVRDRPEKQGTGDARNKSDVHNATLPTAGGPVRCPPMASMHFGVVSVIGRSRLPTPAASRNAFMMPPS